MGYRKLTHYSRATPPIRARLATKSFIRPQDILVRPHCATHGNRNEEAELRADHDDYRARVACGNQPFQTFRNQAVPPEGSARIP